MTNELKRLIERAEQDVSLELDRNLEAAQQDYAISNGLRYHR